MALRLATLNLAFVDQNDGDAADRDRPRFPAWEKRRGRIVAALTELAPDVVCLQEVVRWEATAMAPAWRAWLAERLARPSLAVRYDQLADLAGRLPGYTVVGEPLPVSCYQDEEMEGFQWGTALLSRLPVRTSHRLTLPQLCGDLTRRIPLFVELEVAGESFWVASVHCDPLPRHIDALCRAVAALPAAAGVALLGDFNLDDRHPLYRCLVECGLTDCRTATTPTVRWRANAPCAAAETIDHCLVRSAAHPPTAFLHLNDYPYSDTHWLQVADLA
ncbi:MAG: hypothetical protein GW783_00255 [Deltaproteobacteria bacterium]|nr:hypothetical protein [Deltaproteobacteria bacterium]NCS72552.1 hypothetical protein [Deltaproteobacteria bacterium]OIP66465.1 MAG: hypothetical protein AUK30_02405 [Nitrospirae bacterium CG2_30_70_394]PIU80246.1 MAG: hypothetical protein COS73_00245 [Nitrospirae bacterium CG06_land_8_20_14_3_00_70_43]